MQDEGSRHRKAAASRSPTCGKRSADLMLIDCLCKLTLGALSICTTKHRTARRAFNWQLVSSSSARYIYPQSWSISHAPDLRGFLQRTLSRWYPGDHVSIDAADGLNLHKTLRPTIDPLLPQASVPSPISCSETLNICPATGLHKDIQRIDSRYGKQIQKVCPIHCYFSCAMSAFSTPPQPSSRTTWVMKSVDISSRIFQVQESSAD